MSGGALSRITIIVWKVRTKEGKEERRNRTIKAAERTDGNRYLNREKKRKPTECSAVQSPLFRIFPAGFVTL